MNVKGISQSTIKPYDSSMGHSNQRNLKAKPMPATNVAIHKPIDKDQVKDVYKRYKQEHIDPVKTVKQGSDAVKKGEKRFLISVIIGFVVRYTWNACKRNEGISDPAPMPPVPEDVDNPEELGS